MYEGAAKNMLDMLHIYVSEGYIATYSNGMLIKSVAEPC